MVLRPFTLDDLDDLHAIHAHPDVVRYLYWDERTRDEVSAVLADKVKHTHLATDDDKLAVAVALLDASGKHTRVIGDVSFWWRSVEHHQGEIGFAFHPDFHGRGYAREATAAVLDLVFEALRLHRVYGRTDARNTASAALMRRLGMRQEAHFVQNEIFKGSWGDELVFAVLESEWRRDKSSPRRT